MVIIYGSVIIPTLLLTPQQCQKDFVQDYIRLDIFSKSSNSIPKIYDLEYKFKVSNVWWSVSYCYNTEGIENPITIPTYTTVKVLHKSESAIVNKYSEYSSLNATVTTNSISLISIDSQNNINLPPLVALTTKRKKKTISSKSKKAKT